MTPPNKKPPVAPKPNPADPYQQKILGALRNRTMAEGDGIAEREIQHGNRMLGENCDDYTVIYCGDVVETGGTRDGKLNRIGAGELVEAVANCFRAEGLEPENYKLERPVLVTDSWDSPPRKEFSMTFDFDPTRFTPDQIAKAIRKINKASRDMQEQYRGNYR